MQNQNDDGYDLDDDFYDEAIDEGFEEDFDDSDLELEVDDYAEESEEEWDVSEDEEYLAAGVQKKKSKFNMSFNAMAIMGAVLAGILVLGYQLVTTESTIIKDTFQSALKMSGASDGPVFGDKEDDADNVQKIEDTKTDMEIKGFLHDPESLDSMEMELSDTPPMPTPISLEEVETAGITDIIITPSSEQEVGAKVDVSSHVPRAPAVEEDEFPNMKEFLKVKDKVETANSDNEIIALEDNSVIDKINEVTPIQNYKTTDVVDTSIKKIEAPVHDNSVIEKKLEMIINRLDDMDLKITHIRETGNLKIEDISDDLSALKKDVGQLEIAPVQKSVSKSKKVIKSSSSPRAQPKKVGRVKTARVVWELRAAQPGKAWVSKKGHKNMQPVVIGDSLKGVGRITAISYNGSRWIIQGTSGRILQ